MHYFNPSLWHGTKTYKSKSAFKRVTNLTQLRNHLIQELRSGKLSLTEREFAQDMLKDVTRHINKKKIGDAARRFRERVKQEDAFFKRLEKEAIECLQQAIAAKKAKKK